MSPSTRSALRAIAIATGIGLPTLSLVPFGGLWLYQNGYVIHWALGILAIVASVAVIEWRWLRKSVREPASDEKGPPVDGASDALDPNWSTNEQRAWMEVRRIAKHVQPESLSSRDEVLSLGVETIRAVARVLHEGRRDPHLQFTVPEALAIIEQVSRRLSAFVAENVPLGDRLTVAHAMALYRWRGAIDVADRAFDIWRLIRLANPMTAATYELRERLSRQMYQWGRDHVVGRIAETYVLEIGRAAIDLYSGRMNPHQTSATVLEMDADTVLTSDLSASDQSTHSTPLPRSRWRAVWSQTRGAGRSIAGTFFRRRRR